jgi:membrane fusion protein
MSPLGEPGQSRSGDGQVGPSSLFRREAIEHAGRRLEGEVVLWSPLPASLFAWGALFTLAVAIAIFCFVPFPRAYAVRGVVLPEEGIVRVQAPQAGTVELLVAEGDVVALGAPIAIVRRQEVVESLYPSDQSGVADASLLDAMEFQQRDLSRRQEMVEAELAATRAQRDLQLQRIALGRERLRAIEQMASRGFVASTELAARRSDVLALEQASASLDAAIIALRRQAGDLASRRAEIAATFRSVVIAPIGGRIALLIARPNQAVAAGGVLAVMEPPNGAFEVEFYAPSNAIGSIQVGQEVRLMYDAFPVQTFGAGRGQIVGISDTALAQEEILPPSPPAAEPVYRVRATIRSGGQEHALRSGMQLSGEIITERRSLLQWVAGPLVKGGRP